MRTPTSTIAALALALAALLLGGCAEDDGGPYLLDGGADTGTPGLDAGRDGGDSDGGADAGDAAADTTPPSGDTGTGPDTSGPTPGSIPVIAGVGWQGLRVVSIDEGRTWCEVGIMTDGHDDLFRGAGYHDGLFVGAHAGLENRGAIWVSENGYEWEALHRTNDEPTLPENPSGQWYGGAAYGNGTWLAAGGCGRLAISSDGRAWESVPRFTDGCLHIRSLAFADGLFVAALDDDNWYSSADGRAWELFRSGAGSFVVRLEGGLSGQVEGRDFYQGRGVCLTSYGSPNHGIFRSTAGDCTGAERVADVPARVTTFLFGEAPEGDYVRARTGGTLADCLGLP